MAKFLALSQLNNENKWKNLRFNNFYQMKNSKGKSIPIFNNY